MILAQERIGASRVRVSGAGRDWSVAVLTANGFSDLPVQFGRFDADYVGELLRAAIEDAILVDRELRMALWKTAKRSRMLAPHSRRWKFIDGAGI